MPFFNAAKRRSYIDPKKDKLSVTAGDRLDRLHSATAQDPDARKSGPFAGGDSITRSMGEVVTSTPVGGLHPAAAGGSTAGGQMSPDDHGAAANLHQSLADLYGKYQTPGTDTVPHTTGLTPGEKGDLGSDVDVGWEK